MAAAIRPSALPANGIVNPGSALIFDDGTGVYKATPAQIAEAGRPLASQSEAEAGTDNSSAVSPLRVAQYVAAQLTAGLLANAFLTKANATALGVSGNASNLGTFVGTTIPDDQAAKAAIQALETAVEVRVINVASIAELKSINPAGSKMANLSGSDRAGLFSWVGTSLSAILITNTVTSTSVASSVITKTGHGLFTADAIFATTSVNGLTANQIYYVIRLTADTFRIAASYEDAVEGVGFTLSGTTNFTVKRHIDPRNILYVVPDALAFDGSQGAWVRQKPTAEISVLWAGANTSLADNSAAFAAMANLSTSSVISVPKGDFRFEHSVRWEGRAMVWNGAGRSQTRLSWTVNKHGFLAGFENGIKNLELRDMTIGSRVPSPDKSGVYALFEPDQRPTAIFERLFIRGDDGAGPTGLNWFFRGLHLSNCLQPIIQDCLFQGATGSTIVEIARADAAIFLESSTAAVIPKIDKCYSLNYSSGVKVRSVSTPSVEGVYITNSDFVFVNVGIDIVFSSGSYKPPQMNITTCHVEALYRAVAIENAWQVNIAGNLFYGSSLGVSNDTLVNIKGCVQGNINDNMIDTRVVATTEGIWLEDCDAIDIYNNDITATDTHIAFVGTTQNCTEHANRTRGTGARFADVGSNPATNKGGRLLANPGYEWTAEGSLVQRGTAGATTNASGDIVVTFPRSFNALHSLNVTNSNGAAGMETPIVMARSATGFTVRFAGAVSAAREYSYEARGI